MERNMAKAKFKVGDRVMIPHVGECEVRKVAAIDGVFEYVLIRENVVFAVVESEIQEVVNASDR